MRINTPQPDTIRHEPAQGEPLWHSLAWALGFVIVAIVLRSPALLYSALNFDESMYLLMGSEFAKGHLPSTTVCDLKPFGLFALATPFTMTTYDPVILSRIGSSVTVGLTAWMLSRIAATLFEGDSRAIGVTAGLAYVIFSLADGGMAFQGEIFHNACAVLALLLVLRSARIRMPPGLGTMAVAGLVLGIGIQIKQSVLFDMLAFLAGYFILTTPTWRDLPGHARASLKPLALLGVMTLVPTLVVVALYVVLGDWDAWFAANIQAHRVFYGGARGIEWDAMLRAMAEQTPLWIAALLACVLARWLVRDAAEKRSVVFLAVWTGAVMLCQLFLRIGSDHYLLQFLPPLSLLCGVALARGLLAGLPNRRAKAALLTVLGGLTVFAIAKDPLMHSIYIVKDRLTGDPWAGDTPRRVAADLKPMLKQGEAVYVVGFQPAIYFLTGAEIPTRFAFTGMPHFTAPGRDGCTWEEPAEEMRRILDSRPRFIIIEDGIFHRALRQDVRDMLDAELASGYREFKFYDQHPVHHQYPFERFVMNGGAPVTVYEILGDDERMSVHSSVDPKPQLPIE
ncbi:hypothetical protein N825_08310 [Skermanella stibiiresistens SB22]|uniref:Glycosyltransferase RgtA/B/C/D-like domain-containing protein n=1 Tax=Skermanella stibiiresistens SB22 TaxID=1385369 RepID=W9GYT5_9PROT|nr:hypothetical protein [Skermanella stibiiresistens]EWY38994.1 hypothetical protein N825_08310 [Skermanella stibiiresistens SB22]